MPCAACSAPLHVDLEQALLDLEVRNAEVPKAYLDVTVRHAVGNDLARVRAAARRDGAACAEAERDKRERYPSARSSYLVVPLALETYGRHGRESPRYLRNLARKQAARLEEGDGEAASARWSYGGAGG